MTQTDTSTAQIVQTYYEILTGGLATFDPARLPTILATDLVFEGPIAGHVVGAERFGKGVSGFHRDHAQPQHGASAVCREHSCHPVRRRDARRHCPLRRVLPC